MSGTEITDIGFFKTERIAIFPENQSMKGIFAYLKYLDGEYESRYSIYADLSIGQPSDIVRYFETSQNHVVTKTGKYDITITFNDSFYPTHYSIVNAGTDRSNESHTYNKDWDFVGVDDDNTEFVLDRQRNNYFCEKAICAEKVIKTIQIKRPKSFKKFIIRSMDGGNSLSNGNSTYFILKAIDLFGVLCPQNSICFFDEKTCHSESFHINKLIMQMLLFSSK